MLSPRYVEPVSVVAPNDKLSLLETVTFGYAVFGEKLSRRAALRLLFITGSTVVMALL